MFQSSDADIHEDERLHGVEEDERSLRLVLQIDDPELVEALAVHPDGRRRNAYALNALKIGVLALNQARGRIDGERVRREGERLIETMGAALSNYREGLAGDVRRSLKEYFDPQDGRFSERVERLVRKDGDLENALRAQVAGDGSALARTLSDHIGPESPIMRAVDPGSEQGLAASLAKSVETAAEEQRNRILKEFSLDEPGSALSRTVRELGDRHGAAGEALAKKVSEVVAEFSLDREDSALSRLVRRVDHAQRLISDEFSLDKDGSALARIRKEMLAHIDGLSRKNEDFQKEVIERLTEMSARKAEAMRSTTHGDDFEASLVALVTGIAQGAGDVATPTGARPGLIKQCKTGDIVVEMGPEHAAAGGRIVVEAKQSASYTLAKARAEIDEARRNRGASVGLFVFSKRTAPAGMAPFQRFGEDIFVLWDEDDAASDLFIQAGLSVARALLTRGADASAQSVVDLEAMERAVRGVEKQLKGLAEIDGLAKNVLRDGGKIENRARIMTGELRREIDRLDEGLRDLRDAS